MQDGSLQRMQCWLRKDHCTAAEGIMHAMGRQQRSKKEMLKTLVAASECQAHTADSWYQELRQWHEERLQIWKGDNLRLRDANSQATKVQEKRFEMVIHSFKETTHTLAELAESQGQEREFMDRELKCSVAAYTNSDLGEQCLKVTPHSLSGHMWWEKLPSPHWYVTPCTGKPFLEQEEQGPIDGTLEGRVGRTGPSGALIGSKGIGSVARGQVTQGLGKWKGPRRFQLQRMIAEGSGTRASGAQGQGHPTATSFLGQPTLSQP